MVKGGKKGTTSLARRINCGFDPQREYWMIGSGLIISKKISYLDISA